MSTAKQAMMRVNQREMRARKFAAQIIHMLQDYLPRDSGIMDRIHDALFQTAYETDALIVNLPLEFDHLTELEAKRKMIERVMEPLLSQEPVL